MDRQILLIITKGNVQRTVQRICMLILGCKRLGVKMVPTNWEGVGWFMVSSSTILNSKWLKLIFRFEHF